MTTSAETHFCTRSRGRQQEVQCRAMKFLGSGDRRPALDNRSTMDFFFFFFKPFGYP